MTNSRETYEEVLGLPARSTAGNDMTRSGQRQLSNCGHVTPRYVASVVDRYPAQRMALIALANNVYGQEFARSVLTHSSFANEDTEEIMPVELPRAERSGDADV